MNKSAKLRLKYGFAVLPALILSLVSIALFELNCEEQLALSTRLDNLKVPFAVARGVNYCVAFFCIVALLCVLSPKSQPVFAFGISVWIIFPCISSLFAALEANLSYYRYEAHLQSFNVSTKHHRKLTHNLLTYLNGNDLKCCGLNSSYMDYFPNTTTLEVFDDAHNVTKTEITMEEYFRGNLTERLKYTEQIFEGDLPKSCCETGVSTCGTTGTIFTHGSGSPAATPAGVYPNGCYEVLLKPFKKCETYFLVSNVCPLIILILASIATWCHLREHQGVSPCQLGSALAEPAAEADVKPDNEAAIAGTPASPAVPAAAATTTTATVGEKGKGQTK